MKNIFLKKWAKITLITFLTLIGLSGITLVIMASIINQKTAQFVQEAQTFFEEFPPLETNQSSLELDLFLTKLGLNPVNVDQSSPDDKTNLVLREKMEILDQFLVSELGKNTQRLGNIPPEIENFWQKNKAQIKEIRDHILTKENPSWQFDLNEMFKRPISYRLPNIINIIQLQKLFILDILMANKQGEIDEINQTLSASFKLNQSVQRLPSLVTQLSSLIVTKYQLGVLRQMPNLAPQWLEQLKKYKYDYQGGLLQALNFESFLIGSPFILAEENLDFFESLVGNSYIKMSGNNNANRMRQGFKLLDNQEVCTFDLTPVETMISQTPWWNTFGNIALPSFTNQWLRGGDLMLDFELTEKILEVESIKQKTGNYPNSLTNLKSQVCPSQTWQYEVNNGEIKFDFSQQLPWRSPEKNQGRLTLPFNFTLQSK